MTRTDVTVGAAERLHPLYFLAELGGMLRQMAGGYAAIGYLAATGRWRMAALLLVVVSAATFVATFLHWRRFEYRVGAHEIRIDSGIVHRTHRSIPFDRIQDVDVSQGPVGRLLGIARVRFETGGSAGDKDDDGALAGITLARAEALRDLVRARRVMGGEVAASSASDAPDTPALFAMDLRRVLLGGVFNFSLAVIAGLFGVAQTIGDAAGFNFFKRRFWRQALEAGSPVIDLIMAHQVVAVLAGLVSLATIGLAAGVGRTVLRDFRFRLDRTANGLRRRRGLLTVTDVTLPIRRVQAAIIGSGPVRARFGWSELKLQSLAKDEGTRGDHVVAPLARDAEVASILSEFGWRFPERLLRGCDRPPLTPGALPLSEWSLPSRCSSRRRSSPGSLWAA
ncbi:PH domain-containing protein [Sphingomonas guangdongensis]|uniref:PH domain-containing protein n=1 Tax=Sphingomonas guangdongensis TaxID=1141890 RepID=A0A285R3D3_9SPHN|nr:PH domain-containing protein [Sphingomonas guangdongensis]SOB88268.1 PH domain-containing protein [Sphingomonas guangdongensis]